MKVSLTLKEHCFSDDIFKNQIRQYCEFLPFDKSSKLSWVHFAINCPLIRIVRVQPALGPLGNIYWFLKKFRVQPLQLLTLFLLPPQIGYHHSRANVIIILCVFFMFPTVLQILEIWKMYVLDGAEKFFSEKTALLALGEFWIVFILTQSQVW